MRARKIEGAHGKAHGTGGDYRLAKYERGEEEDLSPRQLEVVDLLARGKTLKEIAWDLHLHYQTIRTHVRMARLKFGATNNAHLVALFIGKQHREESSGNEAGIQDN